jgi:hypothetical protein
MAVSMIGPKFYAFDRDGKPLAFGKVYTYKARTNDPKATYTNEDSITANTNPVILNGEGYADIYLTGSYKVVVKDKDGNEIWTADPVSEAAGIGFSYIVTAYYASSSSFNILGDHQEAFAIGARVELSFLDALKTETTVTASSFDGTNTAVEVFDTVVRTSITSAGISTGFSSLADFSELSSSQLTEQKAQFQSRFALVQPALSWTANTLVDNPLQLYSTGTQGVSVYQQWLPDPNQLPFTTGNTFAEDQALGRWSESRVASVDYVDNAKADAISESASYVNESSITFDSLTTAISKITNHPESYKRLSTLSFRNADECSALGIKYPDGGGAEYVVEALGTPDGYGDHAAGTKQLTLNETNVNTRMYGTRSTASFDNHSRIMAALLANKSVEVLDDVLLVSDELEIPENTTLFSDSLAGEIKAMDTFTGSNIVSIVNYGASAKGLRVTGNSNITAADVENLTEKFNDYDTAVAMADVGDLNGINVSSERCTVEDNYVTQCSGYGIKTEYNAVGSQQPLSRHIAKNTFAYNMVGMYEDERSEYAVLLSNTFKYNYYGVICVGGNNSHVGNKIDHNRVNVMLLSGLNDSHGEFTGGSMNHAKLGTLLVDKVGNGELFTGVSIFDGGALGITIKESRGVKISGGTISRCGVYSTGEYADASLPDNVGTNLISNNQFYLYGVDHTIEVEGSNTKLIRNNGMEGVNVSTYEETLNNGKYDAELWQARGDGTTPVYSGRDIASYFTGLVNTAGAVAIKFPQPMSNFAFKMNVEIIGLSNLPVDLVITGYVAGGSPYTWTVASVTNNTSNNIYDINFGFLADNTPVIYIGNTTSNFRYQFINIKNFTGFLGNFKSLHYYKYNWIIDRESTALQGVTKTVTSPALQFTGDLDTILTIYESPVSPSAANLPVAHAGYIVSKIVGSSGYHEYTTVIGARYVRGYNAGAFGGWGLK